MKKKDVIPVLEWIVENLVKQDYAIVLDSAYATRLNDKDIQFILADYPIKLSLPTASSYEDAIFIRIDKNNCHVDFNLWSDEGPSGLTLSVEFTKSLGIIKYSIEDLHVL